MSYLDTLLFGLYPYIAITIFLLGCLVRYDREQYTWKTSSSQLLEGKMLKKGSYAFHIGIMMILAGHIVGLLTPHQVWDFLNISAAFKQKVAMIMGGFFGVVCFYGLTILIIRRLTNPRVRASSSTMDIAILLCLYVQLILGLISIFFSMSHLDGAEMLKMMSWAHNLSIFNMRLAVEEIAQVGIIYKLHIVFGFTLFVLFPFTRLVHVLSAPLGYIKRNYQLVRNK